MPALRRISLQFFAVSALASGSAGAQPAPFHVLQPLAPRATQLYDSIAGQRVYYVPTMLDFERWGRLPIADARPALTVPSGSVVTFDVVSHEGVLEDQGRDPVAFFARYGVPRNQVLDDAIAVAASNIPHDFYKDGPHVISPPVAVEGARPGDILKIDVLALTPRVPYGVNSIRHKKGSLQDRFPGPPPSSPDASARQPELFHSVFNFIPIRREGDRWVGMLRGEHGKTLDIRITPFLGIMGVAVDTSSPPNSIPPGRYGGNMDLQYLVVGSTLYLPVLVPGALFYVSDSHLAQGNGEVDGTAIEASLRATVRLTLIKGGTASAPFGGHLKGPFAELPEYWIPMGLDPDLNLAMKNAVTNAVDFLAQRYGLDPIDAYSYLSINVDFDVTQVVDITKGIHALIPKHEVAKLTAQQAPR